MNSASNTFRHCLYLVSGMVCAAASAPAFAGIPEEVRKTLSEKFDVIDMQFDRTAARDIYDVITVDTITPEDMRQFFAAYFKDKVAPPPFAPLWRELLLNAGDATPKLAHISACCATEALRRSLPLRAQTDSRAMASAMAALSWLEEVGPLLTTDALSPVARQLTEAVTSASVQGFGGLIPMPGFPPVDHPGKATLGIQLCLTASDYIGDRKTVSGLLKLTGPGLLFWESFGIFLFDNGVLNAAQGESLRSILTGTPRELHDIIAIVVPEGTGSNPTLSQLRTWRQIVYISPIPMDQFTEPAIFEFARSTAPLFTANAAQQLTRAIQEVQFEKRPFLAVRRASILSQTPAREAYFLQRSLPPEVYFQQPGELLPKLAGMYFVDTKAALEQALVQLGLGAPQALNQFLLFADMMSGGTSTTVSYLCDADGRVGASVVPVGRIVLTNFAVPRPQTTRYPFTLIANPISSIAFSGQPWRFAVNANGDATNATQ
jgi:hypothetical protein